MIIATIFRLVVPRTIAIGLKNRAPANQLGAQFRGIDEIAVVAQGNLAVRAFDQERLGIDDPAVAGCRVMDMTNRGPSDQAGQYSFVKDVADVTHGPREAQAAIVGDRDASALLPAVLLRVQAQVGNVGRVLVAVNPKDAARIFEFVHGETAWCRMLEIPLMWPSLQWILMPWVSHFSSLRGFSESIKMSSSGFLRIHDRQPARGRYEPLSPRLWPPLIRGRV